MKPEIAEENLPVAVRRSRHDSKPLRKLIKSQQYLIHEERISRTFVIIIGSIYNQRYIKRLCRDLKLGLNQC